MIAHLYALKILAAVKRVVKNLNKIIIKNKNTWKKTNVLIRAYNFHSIRGCGPQVTNNRTTRTQQTQFTQEGRNTKRQFPFPLAPDVTVQPEDTRSPMSVIKTFLSDECIQNIVDSTNKYAESLLKNPHILNKTTFIKSEAFFLLVSIRFKLVDLSNVKPVKMKSLYASGN